MAVDEATGHISVTLKYVRRTRRIYKEKRAKQRRDPAGAATPAKKERETAERNRISAVEAVSAQLTKLRDEECHRLAAQPHALGAQQQRRYRRVENERREKRPV